MTHRNLLCTAGSHTCCHSREPARASSPGGDDAGRERLVRRLTTCATLAACAAVPPVPIRSRACSLPLAFQIHRARALPARATASEASNNALGAKQCVCAQLHLASLLAEHKYMLGRGIFRQRQRTPSPRRTTRRRRRRRCIQPQSQTLRHAFARRAVNALTARGVRAARAPPQAARPRLARPPLAASMLARGQMSYGAPVTTGGATADAPPANASSARARVGGAGAARSERDTALRSAARARFAACQDGCKSSYAGSPFGDRPRPAPAPRPRTRARGACKAPAAAATGRAPDTFAARGRCARRGAAATTKRARLMHRGEKKSLQELWVHETAL